MAAVPSDNWPVDFLYTNILPSPPIPKNGIITAYTVYCNTSASQAYPEQMIGPNLVTVRSVVNGTTLAGTITGLNPYTNRYDCYVTANVSNRRITITGCHKSDHYIR